MNTVTIRLISLSLFIAFFFSSCSNTALMNPSLSGSASSGVLPTSKAERNIRMQAIAIGAGGGALVGLLSRQDAKGAVAGALIGGAIGGLVGEVQVKNYKGEVQKTTRLARLSQAAKSYNVEVMAYNNQLNREIAQIKTAQGERRVSLATAKRKQMEQSLENLQKTKKNRLGVVNKFKTAPQDSISTKNKVALKELSSSISSLSSEESKLKQKIALLRNYEA